MEIILAIVVASAVIFFGALISVGNERERKAIDGLNEQIALWAIQDLIIKRERLKFDIRVDLPLSWLNNIITNVSGRNWDVAIADIFDEPRVLVCRSRDDKKNILVSPLSPTEIRMTKNKKSIRLLKYAEENPLMSLHDKAQIYNISVLNGGFLFDLELPVAWKSLTGQELENAKKLWIYIDN